jgi:hypothetical protein
MALDRRELRPLRLGLIGTGADARSRGPIPEQLTRPTARTEGTSGCREERGMRDKRSDSELDASVSCTGGESGSGRRIGRAISDGEGAEEERESRDSALGAAGPSPPVGTRAQRRRRLIHLRTALAWRIILHLLCALAVVEKAGPCGLEWASGKPRNCISLLPSNGAV